MNSQAKRQYKKYAKVSGIIGWSMIAFFISTLTLVIIFGSHVPEQHKSLTVWIIITLLISALMIGMISSQFQTEYLRKLYTYKKQIKEFRAKTLFVKTLKLIREDNLSDAITYHNRLLDLSDTLGDITHAFIIARSKYSDNPILVKQGEDYFDALLDKEDPSNIKFE